MVRLMRFDLSSKTALKLTTVMKRCGQREHDARTTAINKLR